MLVIVFLMIFAAVLLLTYSVAPAVYNSVSAINVKRVSKYSQSVEQMMARQQAQKWNRLFLLAPVIFGGLFYFLLPEQLRLAGVVIGVILGLAFPGISIRWIRRKTYDKFNDQLVDALMIMSSSFRGGLSLIQALEAVVEEMPDPINKEFATVLGENKMGVSLEEALNHLYNRMSSVAVQQMNTAILLARETGGNLPVIFNRIVNNIRENKKIQQNLATLTIQGRIQGVVLSLLPFGFGTIVYHANRRIFENMITSEIGRIMLVFSFVWWLIGAYWVWRISTFRDY